MSPVVFHHTFFLASIISAFCALYLSIKNYREHRNLKWILILLIVSVSASAGNIFFIYILDKPNLIVGLLYRYAEFFILFNFYWDSLKKRFGFRIKPNTGIVVGLIILTVIINISEWGIFPIRPINSITFIILALALFWHMINALRTERIEQDPMFWANSAIFILFSGSFFLFLLREYLIKNHYHEFPYVWGLHNILSIVKNFLFGYAFYIKAYSESRLEVKLHLEKDE